jgi:hypothetical protein
MSICSPSTVLSSISPAYGLRSGAIYETRSRQNQAIDFPTIIRLDTKTGQSWYLEGPQSLGGGIQWLAITENSPQPIHDN